jgi:RecA-family ATPase
MDIPEQSYLVKDLLSEQSVNFLSGEAECGKSLIAMNLALSIAVGATKWLAYQITKQGKVLYLNNELAFSDFARRLKTMCDSLPARGDISNLIVPRAVPALRECWDTLNETCEREKPCLIVVDCLYFTHDKDENDSSEMKTLMRQFLALRDKYSLAILLIHHTKKGARYERMHSDQMRGSNVFSGITDTILQLRRSVSDERKRIIKPTKFRHVSDEKRKCRLLSLNPETLWFRDEGETDEGEHIAMADPTAEEEIDFREVFGDVGGHDIPHLKAD